MGVLFGLPLLATRAALLLPLFIEKGGLAYLKWVVVNLQVVAPAAIAWGLLGYMAVRVVADKLLLRTSGDKVRVRA